jgi:N-acetylglutamate synthase-like GNAT family acetyltransferase
MRWRFQSGDRTVSAVRAVDTVTHPDYRRYGIFSRLTQQALKKVKDAGINLIFNTPNATVLPGYLKLGWSLVYRIRPQIKILNYPGFMAGIARNRLKRQPSKLDPSLQCFRQDTTSLGELLDREKSFERLLQRREKQKNNRLHTFLTTEYLSWRYSRYPFTKYRVVYRHKNGELTGCAIFRPSSRSGMREIILSELVVPDDDRALASGLIKDMVKCLDAHYIVTYFPERSFEYSAIRANGFHGLPFQHINLAVNSLNDIPGLQPRRYESWELSIGDLEIF